MAKKSFAPPAEPESPPKPRAVVNKVIDIPPLNNGEILVHVVGTSPLLMHTMSEKTLQELLYPRESQNKAARAGTLKHDPPQEFRESVHRLREPGLTLLGMPAGAFKGSLRTAALDAPGATKAQIGRLTGVLGDEVPVWGTPLLHMTRVTIGGQTPDVRTRAILPHWAARFTVSFSRPQLMDETVVRLVAYAGQRIGIGDWRKEKGSADYGLWRIVSAAEFAKEIAHLAGRKAQEAALAHPVAYDPGSERLLAFFHEEHARRQLEEKQRKPGAKKGATNGLGDEFTEEESV